MRRRESFKRSVAAVLIQVLILTMVNLSGCGKQSEPVLQENIVGDVAQPSPEKADKSEAEKKDETPLPVEEEEAYEYPTENTIIPLETMDYSAIEVSISNYCDQSAIDWAKENNAEDHLLWLSDYVVNCIEPQAVQQLLQIPEQRSEMIQLSDDVLDEVAAGGNGLTVDNYEEGYCPYCEGYHEIVQCQEQVKYNGSWFDMSYCPIKRHYFFEAGNGYFDWNGNMIWGWQ